MDTKRSTPSHFSQFKKAVIWSQQCCTRWVLYENARTYIFGTHPRRRGDARSMSTLHCCPFHSHTTPSSPFRTARRCPKLVPGLKSALMRQGHGSVYCPTCEVSGKIRPDRVYTARTCSYLHGWEAWLYSWNIQEFSWKGCCQDTVSDDASKW